GWHGVLMLAMAAYLGSLGIPGNADPDSDLPTWAQGLLMIGLAAILVYAGGAVAFNSTRLEVTREHLAVRVGPVPWRGGVALASAGIRVVSFRENVQQGYATTYDLVAIDGDGESVLIAGLDNYEVTVFYVREL